jgi:16S rRNA (adenine1518-N6/adenine1519-N6)-dimethyltransferase
VDSAILAIDDVSGAHFQWKYSPSDNASREENAANVENFFGLVRAGFAHKRKLLKRNLEAIADQESLNRAWKLLELDEKARAEDITVEQWLSLSTELRKRP